MHEVRLRKKKKPDTLGLASGIPLAATRSRRPAVNYANYARVGHTPHSLYIAMHDLKPENAL
jgi:hypothetical protein